VLRIELEAAARWTKLLKLDDWFDSDQEAADMAGRSLEFADATFDLVVCPLGMSLLQGARAALAEWGRVTRPGGTVMTTAFGGSAFRPLSDLYAEQLFEYGLASGAGDVIFPWRRYSHPEALSRVCRAAGFAEMDVTVEQLGSYLPGADAWWEMLAAGGLARPLEGLPPRDLARFKAEHLEEVRLLATAGGIWLDVPVASVAITKQA